MSSSSSSFSSITIDNSLSVTIVVRLVWMDLLRKRNSALGYSLNHSTSLLFICSSVPISIRTSTSFSAFFLTISTIPSFSYFLSVPARENINNISSVADDKTFVISEVVSSECWIVSINSLFRFSSISLILCLAGIAFFHNIAKRYSCCSTNARTVLDISKGGGEDALSFALAL